MVVTCVILNIYLLTTVRVLFVISIGAKWQHAPFVCNLILYLLHLCRIVLSVEDLVSRRVHFHPDISTELCIDLFRKWTTFGTNVLRVFCAE